MTIQALALSDAECAELLKALSGPGTQTQKWYAVVRKAFAHGVDRGAEAQALSDKLVEPLIDIAETVARAGAAPAAKATQRYGMYRTWAQEFQSDFSRRLDAGQAPGATYPEDIARFALEKAMASGLVQDTTQQHAALASDVFRDYAIKGSREGELEVDDNAVVNISQDDPSLPPQGAYVQSFQYISNDEVIGFMHATVLEAGLESDALDEAVHTAAETAVPTQAREEDIDLISMSASDVNNDGPRSQIEFLVARLGPNATYDAVLAAIAARDSDRPAAGERD